MLREMRDGLLPGNSSSLKMIPTYVTKLPTGTEKGVAYALDIGGSNLRVLKVDLDGSGNANVDPDNFIIAEIPKHIQESDSKTLFNFIAEQVARVVKTEAHVGFTFSFPVNQHSINSGILIHWTKGFTAKGVEKEDIVDLLNRACTEHTTPIYANVNALINDTTGTLLSGAYSQLEYEVPMGLILGTGSNACYIERIENIKKLEIQTEDKFMIINMESGNFGARNVTSNNKDLPMTKWDIILNEESNNVNQQLLEKQISGMYLGEIVRIILSILIDNGKIFTAYKNKVARLQERYGFPTKIMSEIEADNSPYLDVVTQQLSAYGIKDSTLEERKFVKHVVSLVSRRAALLVAAQIAACLRQMERENQNVSIAIDGSVYEKYPNFANMIRSNLHKLNLPNVHLIHAKDGSGVGAALASFLQQ
uniref:Phosphotransferase n=1 Tax=Arcella intermedia TaxID=1963864 RepID=A0A6B2L5C8_9EUKA